MLPLADREAPGKSELTLTGRSSPAEKLYRLLKLISPVYYQSKEPHCETQRPAKKYICLSLARDWQWKGRVSFRPEKFQGIKCCSRVRPECLTFVTAAVVLTPPQQRDGNVKTQNITSCQSENGQQTPFLPTMLSNSTT